MSVGRDRQGAAARMQSRYPHYTIGPDGELIHRPGYCSLVDHTYPDPNAGRGFMLVMQYVFAALAVATFVTAFYTTTIVFVIGAGLMRWLRQ